MTRFASIRVRLTLWYTLFLALIVLGFSLYLHFELQERLFKQIDEGLRVAASHLLVDVNDTVNPPVLHPMSEAAEDYLAQSSFALRLVEADGTVAADVGGFPSLAFAPPAASEFQTVAINDMPWRIYTQQIETETTRFDTWLQMGQSLNIVQDTQTNLMRLILLGLPVALIIAVLGGLFTANRALHPVDNITRTVQSINATDMSERVAYRGPNDELGRLTETLNRMLDRVQAAFDSERRFTADASHELRTPLTAIKGQVDVALSRNRTPEDYQKALRQIQRETDRLIRLSTDLLFLARLDSAPSHWKSEVVDLSDLLEAVVEQERVLADEKAIVLSAVIPPHLIVQGTADHLIRLFLNLVDNAVKYTPRGGEITITAAQTQGEIRVQIKDSGPGIAPEHVPHLFERFYRVESDRAFQKGGAGLGLAIANQIARGHDGVIHVESLPSRGACFTVSLPAALSLEK
ncbi:MAG: HAMP domain-containing protein [Anaerolineae bacterium]|nr:HAMP domain-containing protein [Anaerolineae bacterium]